MEEPSSSAASPPPSLPQNATNEEHATLEQTKTNTSTSSYHHRQSSSHQQPPPSQSHAQSHTSPRKEDADTCRICRGEGSASEPLFYPCKCSGSIKYVHQDCLMEWLAHSQKKYCELCKTPFHFTKLYSPNMPSRLPAGVFVRRAVLHVLGHLATWVRGLLVGSVWLLVVPWIMRCVWRVMFWVGDAGWARDAAYIWPLLENEGLLVAVEEGGAVVGTNPDTAAAISNASFHLPAVLNLTSSTLNFTQDPLIIKLFRTLFMTMAAPLRRADPLTSSANVTINPLIAKMLEQSQSSILSDVRVLNTLSTSPIVNRFVMDVLEGQIITLSVVVVCILVFLIREWVVQQQPVVDLAAADADRALARAGGRAQNQDRANDDNEGEERQREDGNADHGAEAQVDGANETADADGTATDGAATAEQALRDLRTALGKLEAARSMMATLETHVDGGLDSLPEPLRSQVQQLVDRRNELERKILRDLRAQHMSLTELMELVTPTEGAEELLRELFERLESIERPGMPERGRSGIATDVARRVFEGGADEEQDENSSGSGSWQQVYGSRGQSRTRDGSPKSDRNQEGGNEDDEGAEARDEGEGVEGAVDGPADARDDLSWVSTAASTEERTMNDEELPENPFAPQNAEQEPLLANEEATPGENAAPVEAEEPPVELGFLGRLADWFWGDIQPAQAANAADGGEEFAGADDEHVVRDIADEAPFVPFEGAQPIQHGAEPVRNNNNNEHDENDPFNLDRGGPNGGPVPGEQALDAMAAQGAELIALDADAIEDAEDLEGILELIGMQGPLAGLLQNAVFSSILISLSIALCVFVPYVWGKLVLLHVAEPSLFYKVPLKTATVVADMAIDASLTIVGFVFYGAFQLYRLAMMLLSINVTDRKSYLFVLDVHRHAKGALDRLVGGVVATNEIEAGDFLYLSMACHAALYVVEEWAAGEFQFLLDAVKAFASAVLSADVVRLAHQLMQLSASTADITIAALQAIWAVLASFYTTGSIHLPTGTPLFVPDDPMLTYWNARDRFLAILAGYAAVGLICGMYVKVAPLTTSTRGKYIESHIVEACQQAGGVLKVILIISIEMIAFPLFCGFLLDFALMPLFENAAFSSRIAFTLRSPWTSGFVHWFVGTCYMFHFALFVSMCRRILRTGVLYFIRDPDDPTFHPVRDVLERNVVTQLRKIAFSAIVYGALIVVCLGGIVWGLWATLDGVLPIHWSSTGSNIEFPLDILFYNFLTPFVVHYAKPSAGITAMYGWWFRKVARGLRLSDFLFREQKFDEEGHWVRHTWRAWVTRRVNHDLSEEDVDRLALAEGRADEDALDDGIVKFVPDGRYVRAPASDQVRIPKGTPVFVPVDVKNKRLDGKPDDEGVHASSSAMVTKVYIPPWFKVRVALFIVAVWLFAAATGICVTIVPLLFGRYILSSGLGPKESINDIYAFSLGIYILGGALYATIHRATILNWLHSTFIPADGGRHLVTALWNGFKRVASLVYVYSTLAIGLPLINAVLLEVYILMPMHYVFDASEHHVMHLVQDWTLGILYVRIGMRMFLFDAESRPARAIRQVFANGYLNPDAGRATRFFILPALLGFAALMGTPFAAAAVVNKIFMRGAETEERIAVMRMAYPLASATVIVLLLARIVIRAAGKWRARIRDEVYLVGERLHNFGEKKGGANKEKGKGNTGSEVVAAP